MTLPDHLRAATTARTRQATEKARKALTQLTATKQRITFTAVAQAADVSTDFLYRHHELRQQIERHRATTSHRRTPPTEPPTTDSTASAAVRALAQKLKDERRTHHDTVTELRKALEAAHGENLELRRRRLTTHEPS